MNLETKERLANFRRDNTLYIVLSRGEIEDIEKTMINQCLEHISQLNSIHYSKSSSELARDFAANTAISFNILTGLEI